jgi:hypothetical protein
MGGTEIVGETVHRSTGRWTPAVHALLRYLESVRFSGAPRLVGFDEIGREILSYLPSETRSRRDVPKSAKALEALGRLLRSYHEAVSDFEPPHDAVWRLRRSAEAGMIICHNDVNPGNVVYRGGLPTDTDAPAYPLTTRSSQRVRRRRQSATSTGYGLTRRVARERQLRAWTPRPRASCRAVARKIMQLTASKSVRGSIRSLQLAWMRGAYREQQDQSLSFVRRAETGHRRTEDTSGVCAACQ